MALKFVLIFAVAVVVKLASSDFTSEGLEYDFGDLSDFIKDLKNGTYRYPPSVIKSCFKRNRENFRCLAIELADMTTEARDRFEKLFNKPKLNTAMKKYSHSFRVLPKSLWIPLEKLDYAAGLYAIDVAGKIEYDARDVVFKELRGNKTAIEVLYEEFQRIASAKTVKTKKLTTTLKLCMEKENLKLPAKQDV